MTLRSRSTCTAASRSASCMRSPRALTCSSMWRPVRPDSPDSRRTSVATTAKPRPPGPARAASMAAFTLNKLVCRASLATSSAISRRPVDELAKVRTDCITSSRDWTKTWKLSISPRSRVSHCCSSAARLSRWPCCAPGLDPEVSAPVTSSSWVNTSAKPPSSCTVASCIWR